MDLGLAGKVVVVTGGTGGIGAGICNVLAQEGASLVINYRSNAECAVAFARKLQESYGCDTALVEGDVSFEMTAKAVFDTAFREFGKVDALVNNAAGYSPKHPLHELTTEDWRRAQDANLNSQFFMSREFVSRVLEEKRSGNIVCVLSKSAFSTNSTNNTSYISAKAGAYGLMRGLANEYVSKGIRVNAVVPGYVQSDRSYLDGDERTERIRNRLATGAFATPVEIGRVVAFLCSQCSSQIIGAAIDCTGGMML